MRILSIETSCDETSIAILDISGNRNKPVIKRLAHNTATQIKIHEKYGGVFPMLAKREHGKNLIPILMKTLKDAGLYKKQINKNFDKETIRKILDREPELSEFFIKEIPKIKKPKFDFIAVTTGPGLEPALWVGINMARALSISWNLPVVPVNHMEGHLLSVLVQEKFGKKTKKSVNYKTPSIGFPALSLLVSGGHTELVLAKNFLKYKKIGQTRDDAVGEAFDKVARMLNLPYPGGPQISKLAETRRQEGKKSLNFKFPRPMINTNDFDFSFSGLKTAVLYSLKKIEKQTDEIRKEVAHEFENAVVEVLLRKTLNAVKKYKVKTLIVAGGVAGNKYLRNSIKEVFAKEFPKLSVYFPEYELATDNAFMIGIAGYFQFLNKKKKGVRLDALKALGNLSL